VMFNNLMDGEGLSDGARAPKTKKKSIHRYHGHCRPSGARNGARRRRHSAAKAAFPGGRDRHRKFATTFMKKASAKSGAQGRTRPVLSREIGKDAAGRRRRGVARAGAEIAFFAGECMRMEGETTRVVRQA